jgi:hypothetical protein
MVLTPSFPAGRAGLVTFVVQGGWSPQPSNADRM